jgi:hypothetical protein
LSAESLSLSDFKTMYLKKQSIIGERLSSYINYTKGYVLLQTKEIIIDWDSFKKREKNFDSEVNLWLDTRPLYIDNLSRSISNYIPKDIIKFVQDGYKKTTDQPTLPPIIRDPSMIHKSKIITLVTSEPNFDYEAYQGYGPYANYENFNF